MNMSIPEENERGVVMKSTKNICWIIGVSAMLTSAMSFAGSAPWEPSVSPAQCVHVVKSSEKTLTFSWGNNSKCNEAINNGYARGVHVGVEVNFSDGTRAGAEGDVYPQKGFSKSFNKPITAIYNGFDTTSDDRWIK